MRGFIIFLIIALVTGICCVAIASDTEKCYGLSKDGKGNILPTQDVADDERPSSWDYGKAKAKKSEQLADDGISGGTIEVPKGDCAKQGGSLAPIRQ